MLLVMHNLPGHIKYGDVKILIRNKCYIDDIILDKLVKDGPVTKKVTIGVAKEDDALRIMHRLNGTYVEGQQIFIEEVKKGSSDSSYNRNNSGTGYPNNQSQNQMTHYQMDSSNTQWNTQNQYQQYGHSMPVQTGLNTGYQAQYVNQQAMNPSIMQNYGYNAMEVYGAGNNGIAPLMQSNYMAYGNQQQQLNSSQGQFGLSASDAPSRSHDLGYNARSQNRGYDSDNIQKGYGSQYSGNDRGFGSQDHEVNTHSRQDSRDYGSRNTSSRFDMDAQRAPRYGNLDDKRGFDSEESWGKSRGFSQENDTARGSGDRKRRHSPDRGDRNDGDRFQSQDFGNHGRGYEGQESRGKGFSGNRGRGFGGNQGRGFERDSRNTGFGDSHRDFEDESRDKRFNQGRGTQRDSRTGFESQQRGSERGPRENFGNQGSCESDSRKGFGNNQSRGFENDSRGGAFGNQGKCFGRDRGTSREIIPPKTASKYQPPNKLNQPYSWLDSNSPLKCTDKRFGNKPSFSDKPIGNFDREPGPPLSQSSPVKPVIPEKRPKFDTPKPDLQSVAHHDTKTVNQSVSWRGMGISLIVKNILDRFMHGKHAHGKKIYPQGVRNLKKALNAQFDEIVKRKYPRNPYPLLQDKEVVALYRANHPVTEDAKLFMEYFSSPDFTVKPSAKLSPLPTPQPSSTRLPQIFNVAKPGPASKKPTLSDLLPPSMRQAPNQPRQLRQKPAKKPKPVDLVKKAKREQKMLHKTEFLDQSLYQCKTPDMEKALNQVLDEITNVYTSAVEEFATKDKEEKDIGEAIIDKTSAEFRSTVRLHTIKRILNETSTLMVRIFINGGRAPKTEVERVLTPYGIKNLKASKMSKTPMLMGSVDSYEDFDTLCSHTGIACNGRDGTSFITAKPLHLTIPMKFRRLLRQKKLADEDDEINFDDDVNDDPEPDDDCDDDVIEVIKEAVVIELSGDENTLNVPDQVKNEGVKSESNKVVETKAEAKVDLSLKDNDFSADVSVDDKISAAIAKEMGDAMVEIDEEEIMEDDLEDY
ncbi:uncharacterized protein LOC128681112 [Plodia interpunctella]|uniref:uncharacterized protein LOC128681112 n=1 Tax=Plodia interpunctella TaxID=58824 RepID=UPI0023676A32|nr:uncharacterized protein LOC128681112 [Plodia interpunctella]XP_053620705.1 uncharacterized protein LOC128681112 [Plodia interpunctella]XP_053620707.1 uncharacterized protein LOC128681112 [Plodia interpunctella]XP_053620708.1 uncharacterized protein LOC128681112 [Plodia interpunctella]